MTMLADIAHGHTDAADICFLVALILFAVAAVFGYRRGTVGSDVEGYPVLVALGLAVVSLGWLLL